MATDGREGEAERIVWDTLVEVLDLTKAFERVNLPVVALATHVNVSRKILRVLCGYFEHKRNVQFEGCEAELLPTITAILLGSKWICLLLCIVLQDALSEVTKNLSASEIEVFVDNTTAFMNRRNKELVEMTEKVLKKLK